MIAGRDVDGESRTHLRKAEGDRINVLQHCRDTVLHKHSTWCLLLMMLVARKRHHHLGTFDLTCAGFGSVEHELQSRRRVIR